MRAVRPLLIQNAAEDPAHNAHPAACAGLTRYLGVPIHSPQGEAIGTLCFVDDRSEQLLGEEDIRFLSLLAVRVSAEMERERIVTERVAEHREAAERMVQLNAQLEATAEEKRRFVAMIIHDLRHPLTTLRTLTYLLRQEADLLQRESCLAAIENQLQALNGLLEGLTEYNEIEAGHTRLHLEEVDVAARIRECIEEFAPPFLAETVRFECDIAPEIGTLRTDSGKLTHILLNLLSNALKFTPQGTIRVRVRPQNEQTWMLEVEDNGIGMSAAEQERVFEEFYRGEGANRLGRRGSGLGLAIVRQLCAAMQGTVELSSRPGQGACFRLIFPRHLS